MASAPITIRRARPADWAAIASIHSASWRSAYRGIYPDSYLEEAVPAERRGYWCEAFGGMDPELDAVLLAEEGGRAVGFACLRRKAEAAGPLLDNLHVLPERKGEGIGRRLISAAAAWLVEKEPDSPLQLVVWARNEAARAFYARLGGREVETFDAPTPGGGSAPQLRVRWDRAADLVA
ncbi:MAG TPA: GNAT family N-acetyltransferase [Allosphingosinicella sp.]|jgi:ribosomal protein S18 acetylase RimI-like enzyme|nr:GNAT family N-acetyltransferase [Allosphingosinicella sp.]